jgi:hypothetical protein
MTLSVLGSMCTKQTISVAVRDCTGKLVMEAILETKAETFSSVSAASAVACMCEL